MLCEEDQGQGQGEKGTLLTGEWYVATGIQARWRG
jgi:hypothetical protein